MAAATSSRRRMAASTLPHGCTAVAKVGFIIILISQGGLCLNSDEDGSHHSCVASERKALLDIKANISQDPHHVWLSSWRGQECCSWRGVGCDNATGHVIKLDLRNPHCYVDEALELMCNSTAPSKLNPSLLGLTHLKHLDLSMNDFSGAPIPQSVCSLVSLEYLNLSNSGFGGTVPPHLGNLSSLHFLDLNSLYRHTSLLRSDNLHWLSGMPHLKHLDLSGVELSNAGGQWFQEINMFTSLSVLCLSDSGLSTPIAVGRNFANFTSLTKLDLSSNDFHSTIPQWLFNISGLVHLNLKFTSSHGTIPEALGHLSQLEHLDLSENDHLTGDIQKIFENLSSMVYLDMSSNSFRGEMPKNVRDLHNLVHLDLSDNMISGEMPHNLGDFHNLQKLDLSHNQITGWVPQTIGSLTKLSYLDLSHNQITGSIGETMANLSRLEHLDLSYNSISGEIPRAMGSGMCKWVYLDLSRNNIGGSITDFLDGLSEYHNGPKFRRSYLSYASPALKLAGNRFNGIIPASLGQMSALEILDLSANSFVGDLTLAHFANLTSLRYLNLSYNQLTGRLPITLGSKGLWYLDVSFNNFNGPIPVWNVSEAEIINLAGNSLSGGIPAQLFCKQDSLKVLDLSSNRISGRIPDCTGQQSLMTLSSLQSLHLRSNCLSGEIPGSLQNSRQLVTLDLGENKLSGIIPTWIGESFLSLRILRLRSNLFNNAIPAQLSHLPVLQVLDLARNNLSGILPPSFGNFISMVSPQMFDRTFSRDSYHGINSYYQESIIIDTKGHEFAYTTVLFLVTSIDLSSNSLSGEIPIELTNLGGLIFLNLSQNHFTGKIPDNFGAMKQLESLDLSENNLSGIIPPSLACLFSLCDLNLSNNKLSGKIPSGQLLETFDDPSIYNNNHDLCGWPLPECLGDVPCHSPAVIQYGVFDTSTDGNSHELCGSLPVCLDDAPSDSPVHIAVEDHGEDLIWLCTSIALGFIVGFWGIIGTIIFKPSFRYALFSFFDNLYDWIYVQLLLNYARLKAVVAGRN